MPRSYHYSPFANIAINVFIINDYILNLQWVPSQFHHLNWQYFRYSDCHFYLGLHTCHCLSCYTSCSCFDNGCLQLNVCSTFFQHAMCQHFLGTFVHYDRYGSRVDVSFLLYSCVCSHSLADPFISHVKYPGDRLLP